MSFELSDIFQSLSIHASQPIFPMQTIPACRRCDYQSKSEIRSHLIISMATLVDLITIALSANSTESTKLRTTIIERVGSVGTTIVAFIEAILIATVVLCVDRIELKWTPPIRVVDFGLARPGTVLTFLFDGTDVQTRRHPVTISCHGFFRRSHQVIQSYHIQSFGV